jgi:hypothetical protein
MFVWSKRDNPRWLAFGFTRSILSETEVRYAFLIGHKLTVAPRGERFVAQYVAEFREVFDQVFKFLGIVPIPWSSGEPVDHPGINVDADVEFDAILSSTLSFDPDLVPGADVVGAEPTTVNSDVHLFSSEKSGDSVHHFSYIRDWELFHTSLYHAMSWENRTVLSKSLAVFEACFYAVVGLIESNLEETTYCYGLRVMCFPSFLIGVPWWWQAVNHFYYRFGKLGSEITVHMVRNRWIYPFLCTSHPAKNKDLPR